MFALSCDEEKTDTGFTVCELDYAKAPSYDAFHGECEAVNGTVYINEPLTLGDYTSQDGIVETTFLLDVNVFNVTMCYPSSCSASDMDTDTRNRIKINMRSVLTSQGIEECRITTGTFSGATSLMSTAAAVSIGMASVTMGFF